MKSKLRDYEYAESGLKNVILKNILVHECKHCGEVLPEISNVKQVHKWIAEYLLNKHGPLTGDEFRFLRKSMGKSARELAQRLAVTPVTISRWENNKEKIGAQSDRLLRMAFVLEPIEAKLFSASKLLEIARAQLQGAIWAARKAKPLRIEIVPPRAGERARHASE
jgi:putative zinc finger/helix-turn-helix YgiT family protein